MEQMELGNSLFLHFLSLAWQELSGSSVSCGAFLSSFRPICDHLIFADRQAEFNSRNSLTPWSGKYLSQRVSAECLGCGRGRWNPESYHCGICCRLEEEGEDQLQYFWLILKICEECRRLGV